jgi:hypothetical protein
MYYDQTINAQKEASWPLTNSYSKVRCFKAFTRPNGAAKIINQHKFVFTLCA